MNYLNRSLDLNSYLKHLTLYVILCCCNRAHKVSILQLHHTPLIWLSPALITRAYWMDIQLPPSFTPFPDYAAIPPLGIDSPIRQRLLHSTAIPRLGSETCCKPFLYPDDPIAFDANKLFSFFHSAITYIEIPSSSVCNFPPFTEL